MWECQQKAKQTLMLYPISKKHKPRKKYINEVVGHLLVQKNFVPHPLTKLSPQRH